MRTRDATALHHEALLWDMVWPWEPWCGNTVADLAHFKAAGHDVISATVAGDNHNIAQAISRLAQFRSEIARHPDAFALCGTVGDVQAAVAQGKLAVLVHLEGTRCFERELDVVPAFYALGVRHALLAFNNSNCAGGGCIEEVDGGLTRYGRRLIRAMEAVGMLVDLSHTGHVTARQAMEMATEPCIYSHSNVAALHAHPRNLSDDDIRQCAAMGGVIGISGSSMYLGHSAEGVRTVFEHIDYIAQRVGPGHVGLGIDTVRNTQPLEVYMRARSDEWFDAADPDWRGVQTVQPEELLRLTRLMVESGYEDEDVRNILGGNFLRVCQQVWK